LQAYIFLCIIESVPMAVVRGGRCSSGFGITWSDGLQIRSCLTEGDVLIDNFFYHRCMIILSVKPVLIFLRIVTEM